MSDKAMRLDQRGEDAVAYLPEPGSLRDDDTAERRNLERGLFAGVGLKAFGEQVGTLHEDMETTASDFLGDLMHLCDATGMSFKDLVYRAQIHYLAEIGGEG